MFSVFPCRNTFETLSLSIHCLLKLQTLQLKHNCPTYTFSYKFVMALRFLKDWENMENITEHICEICNLEGISPYPIHHCMKCNKCRYNVSSPYIYIYMWNKFRPVITYIVIQGYFLYRPLKAVHCDACKTCFRRDDGHDGTWCRPNIFLEVCPICLEVSMDQVQIYKNGKILNIIFQYFRNY